MNKKMLAIAAYFAVGSLCASQKANDKSNIRGVALAKALEANASEQQIKELLKDANVDQKDSMGATPVMHAVEHPDIKVFTLILKQKPDLNAQDNLGRTALMRAVEFGSKDVVNALLKAGANPDIADNYGRTVFNLTPQYKGVREIIVALQERQQKSGGAVAHIG